MSKILLLLEGFTEHKFIENILAPHFQPLNVYLIPTILNTKRNPDGTVFKGGIVPYERVKREVTLLLGDSSVQLVSTMFDLYALSDDFPGRGERLPSSLLQRATFLEQKFQADINDPHFLPYFQLPEFESLLFVNPDELADYFALSRRERQEFHDIRNAFSTPEEINDQNPPSKRIKAIVPKYQKTIDGISILEKVAVENYCAQCAHFNQWYQKLLSYGNPTS